MTLVPFSPPPGLVTDDGGFAPGGRWIDGSNVRFWNGRPQVIGGWQRRISTQVAGTARTILEWKSSAGTSYVAYGTATRLYVETGGTLYDITPTGAFSGAYWVLQTWGDTLLACHSGGKLYQWELNTANAATEITNAPDNITTILVTPERQVLAIGCNEEVSGTFNARCIRGCDLEDLTGWTTTASNNAFEHILDGATSGIVTARMTGSYVTVWTQTDLFIGQFLGDPGQTYRFDRVATQCGAIGLYAGVVAGVTAYWVSPDLQFFRWTPGMLPEPVPCPVIDHFRGDIETANQIQTFASHVVKLNEVWFHYPKTSGSYLGRYVAFSLSDGTWFKGSTARRAMAQGLSGVIAVDAGGNLLDCETGQYGDSNSSATLSWSIESGAYFLDRGQRRVMVRAIWPDFEDQAGNVSLTLKTRDYPRGADTSHAAQTLASGTTRKDFRVSGKLVRVNLSGSDGGTDSATSMRMGLLTFDMAPLGER